MIGMQASLHFQFFLEEGFKLGINEIEDRLIAIMIRIYEIKDMEVGFNLGITK